MLHEIVAALRWRGESNLASGLYVGSIECLAAAFRAALTRIEKAGNDVTPLREQLRCCPPHVFLRFLTAPETFGRLSAAHSDDQLLLQFFQDSVAAELSRSGREVLCDHPVWTALGDYCCGLAPNGELSSFLDARSMRNSHSYVAPRIGGVPVDFGSPYAFSQDIPVSGPSSYLPQFMHERLLQRLGESFEGIDAVSSAASRVVSLFTRVIVVKYDAEHPDQFLSSSSPRYVGRTVFCNPGHVSAEILADGLVHESIHGLLSAEQMQRAFVHDHARLSAAEVVSPWTRNVIPMDAFVEACFVWFGLWNFWSLASDRGVFEEAQVRHLVNRSQSGFDGPPLVESLADYESALSAGVLDGIAGMQETVRAGLPGLS